MHVRVIYSQEELLLIARRRRLPRAQLSFCYLAPSDFIFDPLLRSSSFSLSLFLSLTFSSSLFVTRQLNPHRDSLPNKKNNNKTIFCICARSGCPWGFAIKPINSSSLFLRARLRKKTRYLSGKATAR